MEEKYLEMKKLISAKAALGEIKILVLTNTYLKRQTVKYEYLNSFNTRTRHP